MSIPPANPADLKYQVSAKFKPDKTAEWKYPIELDGWMMAHNAIRHEMMQMRGVFSKLGDLPLKGWEIESIKEWWKGHAIHIHDHHSNEDDKFIPFMAERVKLPPKLGEDHVRNM